jgi:CheY-like chemotaxis protein
MANTTTYKSDILLVEDSDVDAKLTIMALNDAKIMNPVITLRDGDEALNYFSSEKSWKKHIPAVILLDLKMPKVNGKEVLRKLKSQDKTKDIPIIVFTSSNEEKDVDECFDIGANSYVVKPVEFSNFEEVVREIGSYWLNINYSK